MGRQHWQIVPDYRSNERYDIVEDIVAIGVHAVADVVRIFTVVEYVVEAVALPEIPASLCVA